MKIIDDAFHGVVTDLPRRLLSDAIKKKLAAQNVAISNRGMTRLVDGVLKGETANLSVGFLDTLKRRFGFKSAPLVIEFTDEDTKAIEQNAEAFIERLPALVDQLLEETTPRFLSKLEKHWPRESKFQNRELVQFRRRLYKRWGAGLELLKMLVSISREIGSEINREVRQAGTNPHLSDVLTRLHARGCQIADEVVCLLESGFADGAMEQWRVGEPFMSLAPFRF